MSGYLYFKKTGVDAIDNILAEVKKSGDAYHSTSEWNERDPGYNNGESYVELIQKAANEASSKLWSDEDMINAFNAASWNDISSESLTTEQWLEQYKVMKNG